MVLKTNNRSESNAATVDRFRGCLVGLAVGDAVGTTLEFKARGTFNEISDMNGGGPFSLNAGEWTDDTSMALCLGASLLHKGTFDAADQMNRYCNWRQLGYMSSNGICFDIGMTVSAALDRYLSSGDPMAGSEDPNSAGNGSIMRLAPVAIFYYPSLKAIKTNSRLSSMTTHGAQECLDACQLLGEVLYRAFDGTSKPELFADLPTEQSSDRMQSIAQSEWLNKSREEIRGSGYVADSLEAAFWCFASTESYRECILRAANLGDDADTTAAIAGQIAGAYYGFEAIPEHWREQLVMRDEIVEMADLLSAATPNPDDL